MKIKGIFFDLGGVLVNTTHFEALKSMASKLNLDEDSKNKFFEEFKINFKKAKIEEYKKVSAIIQNALDSIKIRNDSTSLYKYYIEKEVTIYPNVLDVLSKLKNNGFKLGIITNTDDILASLTLRKFDMEKFFDAVITSEKAKAYKTNKKIFEMACKNMGFKPNEILWVGNSIDDNSTAKKCGMLTALLSTKGDSDYSISSLEELLNVLE